MEYLVCSINGGIDYPRILGNIILERYNGGVLVTANIHNLPPYSREDGKVIGPFAFHIHSGFDCLGSKKEQPFPNAGKHYNPLSNEHPAHAGDFPVLIADKFGYAYLSFYSDRFTIEEIIGKVIIIHESPDDYRSQPSGNSGKMIACGVIEKVYY